MLKKKLKLEQKRASRENAERLIYRWRRYRKMRLALQKERVA